MLLLDYVFAVVCPECKKNVFNLYNWQLPYPICLKCCKTSLTLIPGSIKCHECKQFSVIEKSERLLVEKNNTRVYITDEFLYCQKCGAEGVTKSQLEMKKYRIAMALRYYKKPKKQKLPVASPQP
jgi:hypothetical protein